MPAVGVIVLYAGDPRRVREVLEPLTELRAAGRQPGAADAVRRACSSCSTPPAVQGMHNYWSGDFLTGFPDEAIDT